LIEDRFNSKITVRGDNVYLKGEEEIKVIEKVIKEMIFVLNTSGQLKSQDINTIMD
jgi:hypothetical protein